MPRPKSDLKMVAFRLSPDDLAALDRIAVCLHLEIAAGSSVGQPDRSAAVREAIRDLDRKLIRRSKSR